MKKTKSSKKAALSGNVGEFAKTVTDFIASGKHPRPAESLAFFTIEDSANKIESVLNDRKLNAEQKVALTRKYVALIQECVIDATSFKFSITK